MRARDDRADANGRVRAAAQAPMRSPQVQGICNKGPLTAGQKAAVTLILSAKDRVVGVQGYAGSGKTTMLNRARALAEKNGYRMMGLAPSASAVQTLASEAGIGSETLQRFLARNAGVAEGTAHAKGAKEHARRVREDRAGGRRGLARLHRPGPRPLCGSRIRASHSPRGAGGRREAARCGRCRQALRPAPGRRACRPR